MPGAPTYYAAWWPEGVESNGREYARRATCGGGQDERSGGREMMIWVVWFMVALEGLVIVISLWIMWVMISEASRTPADPLSAVERPPPANDDSALFTLEEVDERGYVSSRKLHMGCEAAVYPTPFGARIVAGRHPLKEPQYAWDYVSRWKYTADGRMQRF